MLKELEAMGIPLLGVAVRPEGCLLGFGETKAAHSGVREPPTARPRCGDGEAHAAIGQPATVALVQSREFPSRIEVPNFGHRGPETATLCMGFGQRQLPRYEEHLAWGPSGSLIQIQHIRRLEVALILVGEIWGDRAGVQGAAAGQRGTGS